ncbi:AsmA family protein [Mariprofundus sp. EBB-1]|uniref:AsmA family protein n=1 Tax=Mariprofundus sp. EBB-1 TaxID=2650971 RepID=UPI001F3A9AAC|nr:AsmA family protein [Mariprofundus sp. EBB-1]
MSKIIRYSLIFVVLIVVVLLAAPFFIDVNTYKGQIEKAVEDQTGRQLSIGNIDASLLPWVGLELKDVHLANRSGFAKRDFLSVERLHVKLALMPLLSKKIEIEHFEVISPVIYLERASNGDSNWGDLTASPAENTNTGSRAQQSQSSQQVAQTRAPGAPALAALQAESLSLTGGQITWVDADAAPVVLSELNVALDDVQLQRPVALRVSGKLSGNAFALNAHVGPVGDLATLNVDRLPLQGEFKAENIQLQPFQHMIEGWPEQLGDIAAASVQLSVQIEQHPNGVRLGEGEMHLKAAHELAVGWKVEMPNADKMIINHAALTVNGKGLLDAKGKVEHLTGNPTFAVRLDGHVIERTWLATFVPELKAMYSAHPAPWKQLQFSALLAGGAKQLDINDLQLKLDNELLKASGAVKYAGPDIRLRMAANQLHLDAWLPQGKQADQATLKDWSIIAEAIAAADLKAETAEPDLRFLKSWGIGSALKVKKLFVRGMQMTDFSAEIKGANGYIAMSPMQFKLSGGSVMEKASLNVNAYPVTWKESVHISGVQAGPLLKTLADVDMLEGSMNMDTKFHATGLTPAAVNTLNGRGTVLFKNGKLKGFDIAGAIRKFTNPGASQQGPQETDFAQLSGTFDVKNGIADNKDLFMASPLLRITGQGKIDLVQKRMDYEVKPRVVGSLKGQGDTLLRKGLTIPLHIYGPFDAPKITPIINAKTLMNNAPALLNKGGVNIGGKLGKILGGGKQAAPQDKTQPQTDPQTPQKQLLKGLGGMIPGF